MSMGPCGPYGPTTKEELARQVGIVRHRSPACHSAVFGLAEIVEAGGRHKFDDVFDRLPERTISPPTMVLTWPDWFSKETWGWRLREDAKGPARELLMRLVAGGTECVLCADPVARKGAVPDKYAGLRAIMRNQSRAVDISRALLDIDREEGSRWAPHVERPKCTECGGDARTETLLCGPCQREQAGIVTKQTFKPAAFTAEQLDEEAREGRAMLDRPLPVQMCMRCGSWPAADHNILCSACVHDLWGGEDEPIECSCVHLPADERRHAG